MRLFAALAVVLFALSGTPASAAGWEGSSVWGGAEDYGQATRVSGDFAVTAVTSVCGASSQAAVWIGLGGDGERTLAQLGLTLTPSGVGAWYQVQDSSGNGYERDVPFKAHAWDNVHLGLAFVDNRTSLRLRWINYDTGENDLIVVPNAAHYWSGHTAEWVVERHDGNPLAHFGAIKWTNAYYGPESRSIDTQPIDVEIEMSNAADQPMTDLTRPSNHRQVTIWWKRCR